VPGQHREAILGLRERLFERGQRGLGLRHLRSLPEHIRTRNASRRELPLDHFELVAFTRHDVGDGCDLGPQRGYVDRRRDDVACQRQIGGLELPLLIGGLGAQSFELPARGAEDIESYETLTDALKSVNTGPGRPGWPKVAPETFSRVAPA